MFVSADRVWIDVKGSGIGHVATCVVRHKRDVIAYLLILWKACLGIERIARGNIRRPAYAAINAERIE